MFENVLPGPPDPIFTLKKLADGDLSPNKVDLGVGVYRNEQGGYHELEAVKRAKRILNERNPGHDVATVQTISGTGANHLAALFLSRSRDFANKAVYIGTPAWGNYETIFRLVGVQVAKYKYYDIQNGIDFEGMLQAIETAPVKSIFILQSCCHNPTGADLTAAQWDQLAESFRRHEVLPFFDIAYQGLGEGLENDAYGIRRFVALGLEVVVAQSFAKNFGLYGERCGALHVVGRTKESADNVREQLRSLIRAEFSSSPAYGSRLVTIILEDEQLAKIWRDELDVMRERLLSNRRALYDAVVNEQRTPSDWTVITSTRGLFCYLPLTQQQCVELRDVYHVHLPETGRINVAGLNKRNIGYTAKAINSVLNQRKSAL
ncbi:hypothetical protein J7T55_013182 [Diaporthe amygdali]|uniref:uncharacterized protein n=1 Tax=Phomopsis amygdali TaxID=1214568 RepID=UPI0022FE8A96|nr:uncharacterized protein J7T55_013182 [Diaporthe amygdali]KAJ0118926.1 hypothetical protein J7T55_013182 [Diaporthe amygdali]